MKILVSYISTHWSGGVDCAIFVPDLKPLIFHTKSTAFVVKGDYSNMCPQCRILKTKFFEEAFLDLIWINSWQKKVLATQSWLLPLWCLKDVSQRRNKGKILVVPAHFEPSSLRKPLPHHPSYVSGYKLHFTRTVNVPAKTQGANRCLL